MHACGPLEPDCQAKQLGRQLGVVLVAHGVAGQQGVNAEMLSALSGQAEKGAGHLILGHAVLGIPGHIHDGIPQTEAASGVVPAAHGIRNSRHPLQKIHMGHVVQVDIGAHLPGLTQIQLRGHIGGKHHLPARHPGCLGQEQLGIGGAVAPAAFLVENLQNIGVRRRLYREELPKPRIPGKCRLQGAGRTADSRLVIDMKGRRHLFRNFPRLFQG